MSKDFICGGTKYWISVNNTIALAVNIDNLPSELQIEGNKLVLKDSFHVSLVCINQIIEKKNITDPNFRNNVLKDFCEFVSTNDINLIRYTNEFRYAEQNDLKTMVIFCEVSNINKFFDILNAKYNLGLEYPPAHITLYTVNGIGIYLTDENDLKNFTKIIPNPIGRNL